MAAASQDGAPHNDPLSMRRATGYMPIENYGLIGNMRTCAMVGVDGGLDYMCWPEFDSPSIFCRLLDKQKGGHFSIGPPQDVTPTTKQQYLPSSNILRTRYFHDTGVVNLLDFFPRPRAISLPIPSPGGGAHTVKGDLKKWLVRRVECMRGVVDLNVELFPAFNYAQDQHTTKVFGQSQGPHSPSPMVLFKSKDQELQLDVTIDCGESNDESCPLVKFQKEFRSPHLGEGVVTSIRLLEGQAVSFILRDRSEDRLTKEEIDRVQHETESFWFQWISKSKYTGRWREVVARSLLTLKLLTYEPTGAIVAAATFSIPEHFGGTRNWDYRYCWVRDSSFTVYILLRMGFTEEAEAYMGFITERIKYSRSKDGALPIMFSIRGETDLKEIELSHMEGYRGSQPVRIGNGAAFHKQLDIYGELLDAIYLYNKYGKPISWDQWVAVREIIDYVSGIWHEEDMSIWETRGQKQNFVYSKVMLWVAFDRAIRLADKRCLPCPHRAQWLSTRDQIYEEVMARAFNPKINCFIQSYESNDILDAAVLVMPLVFFIAPNDPRFTGTIDQILKPPEKGGLTSTGLVYRYNFLESNDGVGGQEGSFSMCGFWLVEALTRAGAYDKKYLIKAVTLFENMLSFSNHLSMFSEEIARSGEQLGNTPQAFSHLALISAAFNLDRTTSGN